MRGLDRERYLPEPERRTALWLAVIIVALSLVSQSRTLLPLSEHPWVSAVEWAGAYAAIVGLLLLLARRVLHGPAVVVGFVLLNAAASVGLRALFAMLSLIELPLLADTPLGSSFRATGVRAVQGMLPTLAVLSVAAISFAAIWVAHSHDDLSAEAEAGGAAAPAWRRLLQAGGLSDWKESVDGRLAVAFAAVGAASSAAVSVLGAPVVVLQAHIITAGPRAGSGWPDAVGAVQPIVILVVAYLCVRLAIVRYGAPRSVWLAFAGSIASTTASVAAQTVRMAALGGLVAEIRPIALFVLPVAVFIPVGIAVVLAAVPRLPHDDASPTVEAPAPDHA